MEDNTSNWLRVVSISGLGQTMNGKIYWCVLCYRLGVALFSIPKPCSACSRVFARDIYGDHVVSYDGIVGIKHRHNIVRDMLVDIYLWFRISASKEVDIGLDGGRDKPLRPADMLLYLHAVIEAAQRKCVKYKDKCAYIGYGFLPFLFSSFKELEKDALTLLKRIRKFFVIQDIRARTAIHIFSRINFAIARGLEGYSFTWAHPSATKMSLPGFDDLVTNSLNSFVLDDFNGMIRFKKKLQMLKKEIRTWTLDYKRQQVGVMVDGDWIDDPDLVKQEFRSHFADRFQDPGSRRGSLNFLFPSRLSNDQILDLESLISKDEIHTAVWGCGVDKSLGPDGFTFEFFRKTGPLLDLILALQWNGFLIMEILLLDATLRLWPSFQMF
nr:RNA-directed DNA polymerase, eukaryota [Tanacetum cinerariifolium]